MTPNRSIFDAAIRQFTGVGTAVGMDRRCLGIDDMAIPAPASGVFRTAHRPAGRLAAI